MNIKLNYLLRVILLFGVSQGVIWGDFAYGGGERVAARRVGILVGVLSATVTGSIGMYYLGGYLGDDQWASMTIEEIAKKLKYTDEHYPDGYLYSDVRKAQHYLKTAKGTLGQVCYAATTLLWNDRVCRDILVGRVASIEGNIGEATGCLNIKQVWENGEFLEAMNRHLPEYTSNCSKDGWDGSYVTELNKITLNFPEFAKKDTIEEVIRALATCGDKISLRMLTDISSSRMWEYAEVRDIVMRLIAESTIKADRMSDYAEYELPESGLWKEEETRHLAIKQLLLMEVKKSAEILILLFNEKNFKDLPNMTYDWGPELNALIMEWLMESKDESAFLLQSFVTTVLVNNLEMKEAYFKKRISRLQHKGELAFYYDRPIVWNDSYGHPLFVEQVLKQGNFMISCAPGENYWADEDVKEKTTAYIKANAQQFINMKNNPECLKGFAETLKIAESAE